MRTDDFDLYKKVTAALEESREKLLQENSERVKTVTTYAAMDLVQFGFPTEAYAFVPSKVCTLAETVASLIRQSQVLSRIHSRILMLESVDAGERSILASSS